VGELFKRVGADVVVGPQPLALGVDDACLAQDLEVVRNGRLGDVEERGQLAHADLARVPSQQRSFGPALAAREWESFWIYVVGPLIGAALGGLAYQLVRGEATRRPEVAPPRRAPGEAVDDRPRARRR